MTKGPKHPQVNLHVTLSTDKAVWFQCDEMMRKLLRILVMDYKITTYYSCQGDVKFKDQTVWGNRDHRAYILMERDENSLYLINYIMSNFPAFKPGRKIAWDIEFDRHRATSDPRQAKSKGRITIRFPQSDIKKLEDFLRPAWWDNNTVAVLGEPFGGFPK